VLRNENCEWYLNRDRSKYFTMMSKSISRRRALLWLSGLGGFTGLGTICSQKTLAELTLEYIQYTTVKLDDRGNIIAKPTVIAQVYKENLGSGINLAMVKIPAGSFIMGSPQSEGESEANERPQHRVKIKEFYMGQTEITQAQYYAIMGENPASFKGENRPVENVSWQQAKAFCRKLSLKTGKTYTLPSESQWEYACRAGTTTPFSFGATITTEVANYESEYAYGNAPKGMYRKETTAVDKFPPNDFGLYDLHGNVSEWCEDTWSKNYQNVSTDGKARTKGNYPDKRVFRGGSWYDNPGSCRSAFRYAWVADDVSSTIGLRVIHQVI
jgi:eukaryotic-like serine/threonine-protein kinase